MQLNANNFKIYIFDIPFSDYSSCFNSEYQKRKSVINVE